MQAEMGMGMASQELDRFQHLVSDLFARVMLTPSEEIDAEVALALPRVLENLAVDDVRLLRFDGEGRTLTGIERSAHGAVPPAGTQPAAESRDWYVVAPGHRPAARDRGRQRRRTGTRTAPLARRRRPPGGAGAGWIAAGLRADDRTGPPARVVARATRRPRAPRRRDAGRGPRAAASGSGDARLQRRDRSAERAALRGERLPAGRDQDLPQLRRSRGHERRARRRARPGVAGGADRRDGAAARRDRHRQGAGRARDPRPQPRARRAPLVSVNCAALPPTLDRERAVRPRARRVHRRRQHAAGALRARRRRHDLPRRDRRAAAGAPGQAAARPAGGRVRARRRRRARARSTSA